MKDSRRRTSAIWLVLAMASLGIQAQTQNDPQPDPGRAAMLLEQQGKTAEAEAAWTALEKAHPANPEPLAHLGLLEARQEHYAQAIGFYRKAMALNAAMPGLRLNLGLALFKDGQFKQAIQTLTPLLTAQPPGSTEAKRLNVLIGMAHYGLADYAAAVPFLKQASEQDAQNLPLLLTLAHSCLWSKQYPCVLDSYHQIVSLNAESAEADILVGEALDEMKDTDGAIKEFRAAVQANPKEPNAHFGLGYLLWTVTQYEEAAQQFQAELDIDPEHLQALVYLADADIQLNRVEAAEPLLIKALKIDGANAMGHRDLGVVYSATGKSEDALRELLAGAKLAPADVNVHMQLGKLYRSMGKMPEAKEEFGKASSLNKAAFKAVLSVMSPSSPKDETAQPAAH